MIRILQCVNIMNRAGLETMLMNYYRNINREEIQFDFLTHRSEQGDYDSEIEQLGGRIYQAPRLYPQNYFAYFMWMREFFQNHPEYSVVHSHIDAMSYLPLLAAKKAGIPVRIAHSHNTKIDKDFKYILKQYFRMHINDVCNIRLACGRKAGQFLFRGREFCIIHNAIDVDAYRFNEAVRQEVRRSLDIHDEVVIGHVGRFSSQKNHSFLIDIFIHILTKREKTKLILVGVGEHKSEIEKKVKTLGIEKKVLFLGNRNDVNRLYQAMDVFLLPSLFEGIPVVGIEAQASGLPCVFSNGVPEEVKYTSNCSFLDLCDSKDDWVDRILKYSELGLKRKEVSYTNNDYNISFQKENLKDLYMKLLGNNIA